MRCTHNFQRVLPILGCLAALASTTTDTSNGRVHIGKTK